MYTSLKLPLWSLVFASAIACGGSPDSSGAPGGGAGGAGTGGDGSGGGAGVGAGGSQPASVPVLGNGKHTLSDVKVSIVGSAPDGLDVPRDLGINPVEPDQLWVVNRGGPSVTIYFAVGTPDQAASTRSGFGGVHFLAEPAALAFGAPGTFATAQEQDEKTQPTTPATLMGPTLWTSDTGIFNAGHASHMDMLHNSPNSVGIAWDHDNVYWVFDGFHSSITRYDFRGDHGLGGEDHTDGIVARYVEGQVGYVPDVPSHLELDRKTGLLYIADTGNARVAALDTKTGVRGADITPNYDGGEQYEMLDAKIWTLVDGKSAGLERPSGIALRDGLVFVADNATGKISAFDANGQLVDWLQTDAPAGGLMGIEFDGAGRLYFADAVGNRVISVSAP